MQIHAIEAGRLVGNETTFRGTGWSSVLRRRRDVEFPAIVYVIERDEGHVVIDTGMSASRWPPVGPAGRFLPSPRIEPAQEIGPRMEALGLSPADVRTVILTHLDPDHVGGLEHFPKAEVLVHRPEYEFAQTLMGWFRCRPGRMWPDGFEPSTYELEPEPYGPFDDHMAVPGLDGARLVALPGHSSAQVGLILEADGPNLFFSADHFLREDWLVEDLAAGNPLGLGALAFPKQAADTTRRIKELVESEPTVLLPAHDDEAPARLEARRPAAL